MTDIPSLCVAAPAPVGRPGACDPVFKVARDRIGQMQADWQQTGVPIALPVTGQAFATRFVATCPDGHRLRVLALAGQVAVA
jgi:hypothetical protein